MKKEDKKYDMMCPKCETPMALMHGGVSYWEADDQPYNGDDYDEVDDIERDVHLNAYICPECLHLDLIDANDGGIESFRLMREQISETGPLTSEKTGGK